MPFKNLRQKWKSSLYLKAFSQILKSPKTSAYILFFDIIFFTTAYYLRTLFSTIFPATPSDISAYSLYSVLGGTLLYIALLLFIYSVSKYAILYYIGQIASQHTSQPIPPLREYFTLKKFLKFTLLNLIMFIAFFLAAIIITSLLSGFISRDYLGIASLIFLIPFGLFAYLLWNIIHSLATANLKIKEILKKAFSSKYIKPSLPIILSTMLYLLIYIVLFYIISGILFSLGKNAGLYNLILMILTDIAYYVIHFYNRVYIYLTISKNFDSSEIKIFE